MTQADAVRSWWAQLDDVDRRRALLLTDEDVLPEHLALGLAAHGVTVVPLGVSPVDGRPEGWMPPPVLDGFLAELRGDALPPGPEGRLCQVCGLDLEDDDEWVELPVVFGLSLFAHAVCCAVDPE